MDFIVGCDSTCSLIRLRSRCLLLGLCWPRLASRPLGQLERFAFFRGGGNDFPTRKLDEFDVLTSLLNIVRSDCWQFTFVQSAGRGGRIF